MFLTSPDTDLDHAEDWVKFIEDNEARRTGKRIKDIRPEVARAARVAPGTLKNIRERRVKDVAHWVYERLRAAAIRAIAQEIKHLEDRLSQAQNAGRDRNPHEIVALSRRAHEALRLLEAAGDDGAADR